MSGMKHSIIFISFYLIGIDNSNFSYIIDMIIFPRYSDAPGFFIELLFVYTIMYTKFAILNKIRIFVV